MPNMTVMNMLGFVISFLILAIAISLGADILTDIRDTQDDDIDTLTQNESLTWGGNATSIALVHTRIATGTEVVWNGTDKFDAAEYNITESGTITFLNESSQANTWLTGALNITYGHYVGSGPRNVTSFGLDTQNTLAKWTPTIVLVVVIAIIIGILMTYLARRFE